MPLSQPIPFQTTNPADAQIAAAAPGTATTVSRGDHVHSVLVSGLAPGNSAPGDVADVGVANGIPRRDHRHGRTSEPISNLAAAVAPTVNEDSGDGYIVGSRWIDTVADKEYVLLDATVGAAVWTETTAVGDASAHIADATDAHDASAISFDDTGLGITASDVQTMGEQLDAAIAAGGIPATIFDAKGDIIVASAADTAVRMAAGADFTVPRWRAAATNGLEAVFPPGYELDYVEFTSPVSITATSDATQDTIVTGSAIAYDGSTVIIIEFQATDVDAQATSGTYTVIGLWDGSTHLGNIGLFQTNATPSPAIPVHANRRLTPSAATHTYSIRAHTSAGTAVIQVGAGGVATRMPGYIRITKV